MPATGSCSIRKWTRPCDSQVMTTRSGIVDGGHGAGFYENFREAMSYLWKDWPQPVQSRTKCPASPRHRGSRRNVATGRRESPRCPRTGSKRQWRGLFRRGRGQQNLSDRSRRQCRRDLSDAAGANSLSVGAEGLLYAVSTKTGKIMAYDASAKGSLVAKGIRGQHLLAHSWWRTVRDDQRG